MNSASPILTQQDAHLFQSDLDLRDRMIRAFVRILDFFGFGISWSDFGSRQQIEVYPLAPTDNRPNPTQAIDSFNHNALRVTRVLKSLRLCGLDEYAKAFFEALKPWKEKHSLNTWGYWKNAAEGSLWDSMFVGPHRS